MSGLETAIRQALARSDRASAETRARIYQSARNALEAGLRKQNIVDQTIVAQQRHRLETVIHAIEQEERGLLAAAPRPAAAVAEPSRPSPTPSATRTAARAEPGFGTVAAPREPGFGHGVDDPLGDPPRPVRSAEAARDRAAPTFEDRAADRDAAHLSSAAPSLDDVHAERRLPADCGAAAVAPPIDEAGPQSRHAEPEDARFDLTPAGERIGLAAPPQSGKAPRASRRRGADKGLAGRTAASDRRGDADDLNDLGLPGAEPLVPRRRRRRAGWVSGLLVVAILVGTIGSAAWWVVSTGLLSGPATPAPSANTVSAEDFDGSAGLRTLGAQAGFSSDWTDVFEPGQESATPGAQARVETLKDESGTRLKIVSNTEGPEGSVAIAVPPDVLSAMSGKTSTLAISVQAEMGKPTQFSVECDFGSLGGCGRHRFSVNDEKSDMLFKITFDRSLAPATPGRILINSDVTGRGAALELSSIKLLPGQ